MNRRKIKDLNLALKIGFCSHYGYCLYKTFASATMEKCDVLYGVTMPQQGVSQMLKVKLADARKMSEDNSGEAERSA